MEGLIRRAGPEDLARLHGLVEATLPPAERWSVASLAGALESRDARGWLALADPSPGAAALGFVLARRIGDLLEVDLVGVAPAARRRGVAKRLLVALCEAEGGAGLAEARLELSAQNAAAAGLYAALGFVVVGRRPRYYPGGSDALLLSRFFA